MLGQEPVKGIFDGIRETPESLGGVGILADGHRYLGFLIFFEGPIAEVNGISRGALDGLPV